MSDEALFEKHLREAFGEGHEKIPAVLRGTLREFWRRARGQLDERKPGHRLTEFEHCSMHNSGIDYHRGFDRAVCSCGWTSAPSQKHEALVMLWKAHKEDAEVDDRNRAQAAEHMARMNLMAQVIKHDP